MKIKYALIPFLLLSFLAIAGLSPSNPPGEVMLAWNPSPSPEATGCFIYYGPASRDYTNKVDVGNVTNAVISNLVRGSMYFFTVTAHDDTGLESAWCNEVSFKPNSVPQPPLNLRLVP